MGQREYLEEDVETALKRVLPDALARVLPGMVRDSLDQMDLVDENLVYRIAEKVVERTEIAHIHRCENAPDGPVCKVERKLSELKRSVETMQNQAAAVATAAGGIGEMDTRIDAVERELAGISARRKQSVLIGSLLIGFLTLCSVGIQFLTMRRGEAAYDAKDAAIVKKLVKKLDEISAKLPEGAPPPPPLKYMGE